ncbi:hypothetical protein A2U01_0085409, partial [Trifolium medium]|nr:hypothetical protein [Trifolium medium]
MSLANSIPSKSDMPSVTSESGTISRHQQLAAITTPFESFTTAARLRLPSSDGSAV